jgi:hypothetical protein
MSGRSGGAWPPGRTCTKAVRVAVTDPRPGFAAHTLAVHSTFPEVARTLRELLGPQLVAYLGSVRETRAVHQWADGVREPSGAVQQRLRVALQVAAMLAEAESPGIAQAWMQGLNPQLRIARRPGCCATATWTRSGLR